MLTQKNKILTVIIVLFLIVGGIILLKKARPSSSLPVTPQTKKLQVVASFYPMYFFASSIGGDKAEVVNITPAGAEPHDYEPTAQDIARIHDSDLLVLNGGKLEPWGEKIKSEISGPKPSVITAGDSLATQQVNENGQTIQDPHVWLDPQLAKQEVDAILQGFLQVDPANAASYQANAQTLKSQLDAIDQAYKTALASCAKKDIVTSHAAFGYLSTRYYLHQIPIAGLSPDAEPSAQQLASVADFVKKNHIQHIFFESLVSPKLSQTIANETGAQTMVLDPIEGITDTDLQSGKNYLTVMNDNLTNLKVALQCQ